ncbi:MAG: sigma factor, partial [Dyadobacter sp.]
MNNSGSDMLLWNTFREGNRDAFARIYTIYIHDLLSYGYRISSNRQLIKDSIQDLFLHLWLHRENISETDSIKYYLFRS